MPRGGRRLDFQTERYACLCRMMMRDLDQERLHWHASHGCDPKPRFIAIAPDKDP